MYCYVELEFPDTPKVRVEPRKDVLRFYSKFQTQESLEKYFRDKYSYELFKKYTHIYAEDTDDCQYLFDVMSSRPKKGPLTFVTK
jgi:hypothetical protein